MRFELNEMHLKSVETKRTLKYLLKKLALNRVMEGSDDTDDGTLANFRTVIAV